uniref:Mitotic spindle assembly checkpoint protein MAD2 n=1 Tax=Tetraselmis sp. GSL018 TaxID=582737 RepID=A0A061QUQ8_9CHLO|mmetsp:Transcript_31294/g.74371  ORF Transcript_31294/g.74371 Transcript_31294/m.74371 type:complete len:212 (-) Transcript_31294:129-764(-)|eukprot:CAMPEP_0177608262 /NCGR_PEP_ID=MMETSP0419_2-20121207/18373_1 /TAXON_ID=582737 /ORGANISM="Tetraselmis sp., Strain GSL018" /LENGTH=211 /DNA_ID=CAMNT_0019102931 /DNA_START=104 /DNA_END=739 /DNA_ORIENTATION=+
MEQVLATDNTITLKGSAEIVSEFFGYAVNSILYQRGVYPPESFEGQKKYGLNMMITSDEKLTEYLNNVLKQLHEWLLNRQLQRLVLVVSSIQSKEVLERWAFNIETDKEVLSARDPNLVKREKSKKEITSEIQAIIRQITASVTFLPLLDESCSFDLLMYTDANADVPQQWEESDARFISNAAEVKLRSFSTKVHKIDSMVTYKMEDDNLV